jgi:hypothetical protein
MAKRKKSDPEFTPASVLAMEFNDFSTIGLNKLTEVQLKEAIELELNGKNRASILERIHKRYNSKRFARERAELAMKMVEAANG